MHGLTLGDSYAPARLAAALTVLVGTICLAGWAFDLRILTSVIPGAVEMKVNTALCIILCGTGLLLLAGPDSPRLEGLGRAAAVAAALIGLITLGEHLFEWQVGIDELLIKDRAGAYNPFRGRMSPFSATAFVVLGLGIAGVRIGYLDRAARIAAGIGMAIGLISLTGYLWNARELTTDRWLPPVALNTAFSFVCIGVGLLLTRGGDGDPVRRASPLALAGVELRILAGFMVAIVLLMIGGSLTYRNSVEFANSVEWIAHTQVVRTALADLYGSVAGAEVASRDYFLTHEQAPLDEARRLGVRIGSDLRELELLLVDNPTQLANLRELRRTVDYRVATLEAGQRAFQDYGIAAVRAVLAQSRHQFTVEDVRAVSERMDVIEAGLLQARQASAARVRFTTLVSLLVTLAAAVGLFVALFRGIHREMLARRSAERALRDSDQYNRSIIESSPDCVAVLTTGAHVTHMNPVGLKLMDLGDSKAVAGLDWCGLWSGEHREAARAAVARARKGEECRFNGLSITAAGVERWWDVIVIPIRTADGQPQRLLATARDITEVKRIENNLVAANRFLDSLIENLPVMVVVKDAKLLNFVRVNRSFEELIGYPKSQLIGRGAHDLFSTEEADFVVAKDREALALGRLVDIPQQTIHTAHSGLRSFHTMKLPIGDGQGKPQFLLAISVDITERKLAEEAIRELNQALSVKAMQLESSNKELESFSYSVSHDLRAPLRAIDGFAEILEEDYRDKLDAEGKRYLAVIRDNSKRMGMLIDDLLSFSRLGRQTVNSAAIDMQELVREVVEELTNDPTGQRPAAAAALAIDVGPLPPAQGDRALLRQVWINLIANAVKYSSKSAAPRVTVSGEDTDTECRYSVRDNGVGFDMEYAHKLFGVFQRLHRADEFSGTGVGLAIVHRVITRHGGRVWAEGKVGQGAIFSFALPKGVPHE